MRAYSVYQQRGSGGWKVGGEDGMELKLNKSKKKYQTRSLRKIPCLALN